MFGNPETTPGGRALKFYSSVRIDVRRLAKIKQGEEIIGNRVRATVVKNKVAPPFRKTEFDIFYNEGISFESDLVNVGAQYGIVAKSGSWYAYDKEKLGQGMEGARKYLKENPQIAKKIIADIKKAILAASKDAAKKS